MQIGVISEGHADRAVIENILIGVIGVDSVDIVPIRPQYLYDETDKAKLDPLAFSNWAIVVEECQKKELINKFFTIEGQDFIVIHLDTAEADLYGVKRPVKNDQYCVNLRNEVVSEIDKWLGNNINGEILHAVAVEEIDAWVLTIFENRDTSHRASPKEELQRILGKLRIKSDSNYENYIVLSNDFSSQRKLKKNKFAEFNCSLKAFIEEINEKILQN